MRILNVAAVHMHVQSLVGRLDRETEVLEQVEDFVLGELEGARLGYAFVFIVYGYGFGRSFVAVGLRSIAGVLSWVDSGGGGVIRVMVVVLRLAVIEMPEQWTDIDE